MKSISFHDKEVQSLIATGDELMKSLATVTDRLNEIADKVVEVQRLKLKRRKRRKK